MTGLLENKRIVITGAAAGIGLGIARVCAEAGAHLILADIDQQTLASSSDSLAENSGNIRRIPLDVSSRTEVKRFCQNLEENGEPIHGLVNNAGVTIESDFLGFSEDDVERLWQTNLRSVFLMCQGVAKTMKNGDGGAIVNIASVHEKASIPGYEMYAATKAGVAAMTRAMSWSLGRHQIRVNAVSPGLTRTEKISSISRAQPDLEAKFRAMHATGNYASVEEVGEVVAFLLSNHAAAVTGANIVVDHGESALLTLPETLQGVAK